MDSMLNFDITSIIYRYVEKHEQQKAVDLWCPIFKTNPDLEERYFSLNASPSYQEGDTLGAWHNNKLVSTVHIRRLTLRPNENNETYLCGGITNVVTADEYRNYGLSRHLLQMALDKMKTSNEFDMSMLGTGKPSHFTVLGWEQLSLPAKIIIDWKPITSSSIDAEWRRVSEEDIELLLKIHSNNPRIYQIDRSPSILFEHWVKPKWQNSAAIICLYEQGYVVIGKPDNEKDVCVLEWQTPNVTLEKKLLLLAATEIRERHVSTAPIRLFALPQYITIDELTEWAGSLQIDINQEIMMRNIQLPNEVYEKIKFAYSDGHTVFWSGDYF